MDREPALSGNGPPDVVGVQGRSPTRFSWPECNGVLSELREGSLLRFRCRIGHQYSPQSVSIHQSAATQRALSSALTAVNERGLLLRRLAREAGDRHDYMATRPFEAQARAAEARWIQMREWLDSTDAALDGVNGDATAAPG